MNYSFDLGNHPGGVNLLVALQRISGLMCANWKHPEDACAECPASNDEEYAALFYAVELARVALQEAGAPLNEPT